MQPAQSDFAMSGKHGVMAVSKAMAIDEAIARTKINQKRKRAADIVAKAEAAKSTTTTPSQINQLQRDLIASFRGEWPYLSEQTRETVLEAVSCYAAGSLPREKYKAIIATARLELKPPSYEGRRHTDYSWGSPPSGGW
jgi:hypothetical protein